MDVFLFLTLTYISLQSGHNGLERFQGDSFLLIHDDIGRLAIILHDNIKKFDLEVVDALD